MSRSSASQVVKHPESKIKFDRAKGKQKASAVFCRVGSQLASSSVRSLLRPSERSEVTSSKTVRVANGRQSHMSVRCQVGVRDCTFIRFIRGSFPSFSTALKIHVSEAMDEVPSAGNGSELPEEGFVWGAPPVQIWCFDLIVYYKTIGDAQSKVVLEQLERYSKFSFLVNGVITCALAAFGLIGNATLLYQIRHSRHFSKRLASHLMFLCLWDMLLLLCCLLTYGVISLYYGAYILYLVGSMAYVLFFFQPLASFCVTGTIWQCAAITIERYWAVSRPLQQRTMKAQFSVPRISFLIGFGALILNVCVIPFERSLTECYEITESGFQIRTMITQQDLVNNQYYAILVHLIPDILFRAPLPIVLIACLTVRTLQICRHRTVGHHTFHQQKKNIPFMLTLLNAKFILCNTLYLFNTFIMEVCGYGSKTSSQTEEYDPEAYISSLYLTDISNALLALHSATNWILFCHWPSSRKSDQKNDHTEQSTMLSSGASLSKAAICDKRSAESLLRVLEKSSIAKEALVTLCIANERFAEFVTGEAFTNTKTLAEHPKVAETAATVSSFIGKVLSLFADKTSTLNDIKAICRQVGYDQFDAHIHCSTEQWKLIREEIVRAISSHGTLQRPAIRVYNWVLREIKSGALCASVDASQQWKLIREEIVRAISTHGALQRPAIRVYNWVLREIKSGALCASVDASQQQFRYHKTSMPECPAEQSPKQPLRRISTVIPRLFQQKKNSSPTLTPLTYILPPRQAVFRMKDRAPHPENSRGEVKFSAVSEC
uniref:G_PROTEIN_RECEP_F1_2 domain-containing protein n=1 Tax=Steinernema glaseri TaxID=37863 RepID=A0A1I8AIM8_9BILA